MSSSITKLFACTMGLGMVVYAGFGLWQSTAKRKVFDSRTCGLWFCPGEFSDQRVYELHEESAEAPLEKAPADFKRALMREPASAYRWADLGEALERDHKLKGAEYCFERALARGPHSPAILLRAANFYFSAGDTRNTFRSLEMLLGNPDSSGYYEPAFLTYSRMDVPITHVLDSGIPRSPLPAQAFLHFLIKEGRVSDVEAAWNWMVERSLSDDRTTADYLNFLLGKKQMERAAESWQKLNRRASTDYRRTNWIFNAGFESPGGPAPLDWHIEHVEDVTASRACSAAAEGRCCLELTFRGAENIDYHGVSEETVISPGTWQLRALVKSDDVTTDQGISLRIYDAIQPKNLDIRTESLTGTHGWRKVECLFHTGPATSLVRVEITRQASVRADNKIAGKAWIDSVSLRPSR